MALLVLGVGGYLVPTAADATPALTSITGVGGKCLDNSADRRLDYNKVDLFTCMNGPGQAWNVQANGTITNSNGYCLDVEHAGRTNGTKVDLYRCNGTVAQQWVVNAATQTITNPHSDMCLDDQLARTANGNQIQIWQCLADQQQRWTVTNSAGSNGVVGGDRPCSKARGPFTVEGTHILQGNGHAFVPYGVTLSTPQYYPHTYLDTYRQTTLAQTQAQLQAIATGWCGNTVRLQVEQDELVGVDGNAYNQAYIDVIKAAVQDAESLGLVVVINDQTEPGGPSDTTQNEPLPTAVTEAFWHVIDRVYAHDPQVMYDIFNEPRPFTTPANPEATYWAQWRDGGQDSYTYQDRHITIRAIGEQALANYIRSDGSTNVLWVEGLLNLDYLASSPGAYLLKGDGPVVYSYHHTANGLPHDPATWDAQFGTLVRNGIAPVVDGEWTNYANYTGYSYPNGDSGECWANAPTAVPAYLQYLQNLEIGMTVWTLGAGLMNATPGNYVSPTQFKRNWACKRGLDQGAGADVQTWYHRQTG